MKTATEVCPLCAGSGWKPVPGAPERGVTRCDCQLRARGGALIAAARIPKRYEHCELSNFEFEGPQLPLARARMAACRHYLYRFWRRLPERGQIAIFDRSWYGRVLVERVEGFAKEEAWKRAFKEINSFERQLKDFGTILAKFWIHISQEEQFRRFEERKAIGYKSWKLTEEDWRNRQKWSVYEEAVEEMLVKTSTKTAPWCLVEGNDKYWARVKVLSSLVEILSAELDYKPADPLKRGTGKKAARPATGESIS